MLIALLNINIEHSFILVIPQYIVYIYIYIYMVYTICRHACFGVYALSVQLCNTSRYVTRRYLSTCECSHQTHVGQPGHVNAPGHAQSVMGSECSNNHEGSELCNIASGHPINSAHRVLNNTEVNERNTICRHACFIYFFTNKLITIVVTLSFMPFQAIFGQLKFKLTFGCLFTQASVLAVLARALVFFAQLYFPARNFFLCMQLGNRSLLLLSNEFLSAFKMNSFS